MNSSHLPLDVRSDFQYEEIITLKRNMKKIGFGLAVLSLSLFTNAAQANQKIGYVATGPVLAQMAQKNKVNEKLRAEFKDRLSEVERIQKKLKNGLEKLNRDGELMSEAARTKLQRELQSLDADLKLKVTNLREDERKRSGEEQRKLVMSLQKAIQTLAKRESYDLILDGQAVLFASPKDDLSDKLLKIIE